ncbi:hypothetical protein [Actinoplanes sp. NPDC049316]|uniref:hypothetical protein n=1 Tax=Actinoplanes sp. NPDC049316 TaxID=3154727 RepID=UPI003425DB5C
MRTRPTVARRRLAAALTVLRGRRPKFDYGPLVVMPFLAAAGGVLISFLIEDAVERHRAKAPAPQAARRRPPIHPEGMRRTPRQRLSLVPPALFRRG